MGISTITYRGMLQVCHNAASRLSEWGWETNAEEVVNEANMIENVVKLHTLAKESTVVFAFVLSCQAKGMDDDTIQLFLPEGYLVHEGLEMRRWHQVPIGRGISTLIDRDICRDTGNAVA